MPHITTSMFSDRVVTLILGARDLPRRPVDYHILLISSILGVQPGKEYRESELNDELQRWVLELGSNFGLDHVTLRRFLIDARYLFRDPAGTAYRLHTTNHRYSYDSEILSIDLPALIANARNDRAKRKQRYLESRR